LQSAEFFRILLFFSVNKYKLLIAYDGTKYGGWQIQPNALSIQEVIQKALSTLLREDVVATGAARTDSGVHALGQVAHFSFGRAIDLKKLHHSLNALLPPDVRVRQIEPAPAAFHARYDATAKIYHYHADISRVPSPFRRAFTTPLFYSIDLPLVKEAAAHFVGEHNFSAFANENESGCASKDPVRNLFRLDVVENNGLLRFEFEGEGFLYKMVRNITGTLLDIGRGKIALEKLPLIFESKDRRKAGQAAPAQGLVLIKVCY
jgi:tRNA pseudouridine38-40 synthase